MIAEVAALHRTGSIVRIPPADDVPMSARVRRVIDTPPLRRLASISQLGMVALVYPGATHSRFEHSLGVYHNALRLLARFSCDAAFTSVVDAPMADAFVLAALIHDVGHWPFCHPIEDIDLDGLDEHENRVALWFDDHELIRCVDQDWLCDRRDVLALLEPKQKHGHRNAAAVALLRSCLSGPIDVDKLDYLQRDSLHAGVPYGRNFDAGRLIRSMCVHPDGRRLAVGEKGRTAAEMMVFSRYIMFSEVYWHHAVRSATAMLQRTVFTLHKQIDWEASLRMTDASWIIMLQRLALGTSVERLVDGLFGSTRELYKRVVEINVIDSLEVHRLIAQRPYWWLVACSERLAERLSLRINAPVSPIEILLDAPPVKLEVDINIDVVGRDHCVHSLGEVSPVASALANRQFDDQVKRVRLFVPPERRGEFQRVLPDAAAWSRELINTAKSLEQEMA